MVIVSSQYSFSVGGVIFHLEPYNLKPLVYSKGPEGCSVIVSCTGDGNNSICVPLFGEGEGRDTLNK